MPTLAPRGRSRRTRRNNRHLVELMRNWIYRADCADLCCRIGFAKKPPVIYLGKPAPRGGLSSSHSDVDPAFWGLECTNEVLECQLKLLHCTRSLTPSSRLVRKQSWIPSFIASRGRLLPRLTPMEW